MGRAPFPKFAMTIHQIPEGVNPFFLYLSGPPEFCYNPGRNHIAGERTFQQMTPNQRIWAQSRNRLAAAVAELGYPEEFADLLAKQLRSPKAIDRMAAYLDHAHPATMELIVDEMLAICAEIDTWREKKESQEAQAGYTSWLNSDERDL